MKEKLDTIFYALFMLDRKSLCSRGRMRSVLLSVACGVFLSIVLVFQASAAGNLSRLIDNADLLSDREEADLVEQLDEISERQQVDIVVLTVDSLGGATPAAYADDYFDYNGYGFGSRGDGILFLISMEERDWYISTKGYGITAITDAGLDYMSERFLGDLSAGDYAAAFTTYAKLCDDFITQAKAGKPYDVGNLPKAPFGFVSHFLITFGIGFVVALIVTGSMKGKLKTVRGQSGADNYVMKNSLQLTRANDFFLYRHVDRTEKPQETSSGSSGGGSSTHTSSSGSTHGGGGGKF